MVWHIQNIFVLRKMKFFTFYNLCKWKTFKLIQVLPWRCVNCKPLHNGCTCPQTIYILWYTCINLFLNIKSLPLHKNDVFSKYNLKIVHILCFNETHFNILMFNNTSSNIDTRTHSMINVNGWNGTMIIYDNFTTLSSHETFTSLGLEYITTTFNANTRKVIHIVVIYRLSTLSLLMFVIHLQKFLDLMPISCPMIIIDDFNIDMFDWNSTQPNELQSFMDQYSMKLQLKEITTIYGCHIDHIWTNAPTQQCISRVVEAYLIDHKPIDFAFKLLDYVPQYHHISKK